MCKRARVREGVLHATIKTPRFIRLSDKSRREDGPDGACRYDLPALMPHLHARGLYSPMLQARTPRRSAAAQRSGAAQRRTLTLTPSRHADTHTDGPDP
jgi:hypothetical protein